jgi:F0F1-type ATP synthase epsilon subunit
VRQASASRRLTFQSQNHTAGERWAVECGFIKVRDENVRIMENDLAMEEILNPSEKTKKQRLFTC